MAKYICTKLIVFIRPSQLIQNNYEYFNGQNKGVIFALTYDMLIVNSIETH